MINNLNNQISFQARLNGSEYSSYCYKKNYNGRKPDSFALEHIRKISAQKGSKLNVFDIAAGQGRNTLPIAKEGHDVFAFEINPFAQRSIEEEAKKLNLSDRIKVLSVNILDSLKTQKNKKADFVLMSHISQHFTPEELQKVLSNAEAQMTNDTELVMDALVRKNKDFKKYDELPFADVGLFDFHTPDSYGSASFWKEDILKAAEKANLKIVEESAFKEKGLFRNRYEKQNLWGGFSIIDYLLDIPRVPVKLTWFVLKKK